MQRLHAAKSFTLSSRLPVPSFSVGACHVTVISDLQTDPGLWLAPDLAMGTGPRADVTAHVTDRLEAWKKKGR